MRWTGFLFISTCIINLAWAQANSSTASSDVWLANGVHVKFITHVGGKAELGQGVRVTASNFVYREFLGAKRQLTFGYQLQVDRNDSDGRLHVFVKPLGADYVRALTKEGLAVPDPLPTFAAVRELPPMWPGDQATIDVLSNPKTGQMVTDTLEVGLNQMQTQVTVGDQYALGFEGLRVFVDGKLVSPQDNGGGVYGDGVLVFYLPGRGSYYFSTQPQKGYNFFKVGVVDGNRLTFTLDNVRYECVSKSKILGQSARGELWILHDPRRPGVKWLKNEPSDSFFIAAADDAKSLVPAQ